MARLFGCVQHCHSQPSCHRGRLIGRQRVAAQPSLGVHRDLVTAGLQESAHRGDNTLYCAWRNRCEGTGKWVGTGGGLNE
eukprot:7240683-Pyramimonas_sp.AAC.1